MSDIEHRIVAHEDCLNCSCSNDELCSGTQPRRSPARSSAGIERPSDLKTVLDWIKDPVTVHLNMLRGTIAKPTWDQIKHLYPEQFAAVAQGSVEQAKAYVDRAIASYVGDPADNQFQKGFLAALEVVRDEAFTIPSTPSADPISRPPRESQASELPSQDGATR